MADIHTLYVKYSRINKGKIGKDEAAILRNELKSFQPGDLTGWEEHEQYLELLRIFRELIRDFEELNGENFLRTIQEMLRVGTNGIYSDELHFMDELIQNVDDCEYDDPSNAKLNIKCDFNWGKIVFEYNEKGFSPFNVFAITGIAEQAKNIDSKKVQIGEKGLGFKSVFGVADTVLIQSGDFSFELKSEDFTCPIPRYDFFEHVDGTRLTLFMESRRVKKIFDSFLAKYKSKDALLCKNPLLFLNKLTELRVYFDGFRSLKFTAERRTDLFAHDGFQKEEHIKLTYEDGKDFKDEITGTHYFIPIVYDRESCVSRYGEKTEFSSKKMSLQIVVPDLEYIKAKGINKGAMYSFLPTKIEVPVPIVCHVPFKLDVSREQVDPQNESKWFAYSCEKFSEMFKSVLLDLRETYKENIVFYLPKKNTYLFRTDKEYHVFDRPQFKGEYFLKLPLFYVDNVGFLSAEEVYVLSDTSSFECIDRIAELLREKKHLFHNPKDCIISGLNIDIIQDVPTRLFNSALRRPGDAAEIFEILGKCEGFDFRKSLEEKIQNDEKINLNLAQSLAIFSSEKCASAFKEIARSSLKKKKRPEIFIDLGDRKTEDVRKIDLALPIEESDFGELSRLYLFWIHYQCILLENLPKGQYFITHDALILDRDDYLSALSSFCRDLDSRSAFAAKLELRSCSRELDLMDDSVSAVEYLNKLREIRKTIRDVIGGRIYENYVRLINQAGEDPSRYLNELLQNADDCKYAEGVTPTFKLEISKDSKKLGTKYNEIGFTKANVRAITAIGESTKNKLMNAENPEKDLIGEKGVGFKSVFAVADSVSIYSGDFCFRLTDKEPTVPQILKKQEKFEKGTVMLYNLKKEIKPDFFSEEKVLRLCLCLRKLRHIRIEGPNVSYDVRIEENQGVRSVSINGNVHKYKVYTHNFTVSDERAISQREGEKERSKEQKIKFYIPLDKKSDNEGNKSYLYSGLPTEIQIKIPLIIDAPFELNTARTDVISSEASSWNNVVLNEIYAFLKVVLVALRETDGIDVLRFLKVKREGCTYTLDLFSNEKLNQSRFLSIVKDLEILPTWKLGIFARASRDHLYRIPDWLSYALGSGGCIREDLSAYIQCREGKYEETFNALGVKIIPSEKAVNLLKICCSDFLRDETFFKSVYKYLEDLEKRDVLSIREHLKMLKIIPVKGTGKDTVQMLSWNECRDNLYIKNSAEVSMDGYWILKTELIKKDLIENLFDVHINELTSDIERVRYENRIREKVENEADISALYDFLLSEFIENYDKFKDCRNYLIANKNAIPMKNQLDRLQKGSIYTSKEDPGYFEGDLLRSHIVHKECDALARFMACSDISYVHYEDLHVSKQLSADDIESLLDDGISYGYEILLRCLKDGFISDELMQQYHLEVFSPTIIDYDESIFNQPISDKVRFDEKMKERLRKKVKIVWKSVTMNVRVGENKDGAEVSIEDNDRREYVMRKYIPQKDYCVCQMCGKAKKINYIEVNNVEKLPKYFWEECGIALCLECSKRFEELREIDSVRERFHRAIKEANVSGDEPIRIPIGNDTITFGQTHLAEIQAILAEQDKMEQK